MVHELKICKTGEKGYPTTVEITEREGILTFTFVCESCKFFCPYSGYNKIHSCGDACEILIGSDPARKFYYELEISAKGDLMIALIEHCGEDEALQKPIIKTNLIDECFSSGTVTRTENGYIATLQFPKEAIRTGDGEIYFNAFRLETDGEEGFRHLFALQPTGRPRFHIPARFCALKDYV